MDLTRDLENKRFSGIMDVEVKNGMVERGWEMRHR